MTLRKHTNRECFLAIEWLESRGWSINADGTITRTQMQAKKITHDPRANAEPRYIVVLERRQATIKVSDLVAPSLASWRPRSGLTRKVSTYGSTLSRKRAPGLPGAARAATVADTWRASGTLATQTSGNAFNVAARAYLHEYSQQRSSRCSVGTFIAPNFHFSTCGVAA